MQKLFSRLGLLAAVILAVQVVAVAQPKHAFGARYNMYNYVSPRFTDFDLDEAGIGDVFSEVDGGGIELYYDHRVARNTFIEIPFKYGKARVPRSGIADATDHTLISMDALVKHQFLRHGSIVNPYVHFGAGFTADNRDNEKTDFNVPLGLGLNVRLFEKGFLNLQTQYRTSTQRREGWHHGLGFHYHFGGDMDASGKAAAGKVKNNDRDGDGVTDDIDLCPDAPGPVALLGCPDRDGDGIPDKDDRCPDVKGLATNGGCPEISREDVVILQNAVRQVQFETAKATLLPASLPILDEVARLMKKYPAYSLQIDGHTDSQGDDKMNEKLSLDRAKACYDYLMTKGVSASRMKYAGYGESRPIADNNTAEGRELNRRVEFKMSVN